MRGKNSSLGSGPLKRPSNRKPIDKKESSASDDHKQERSDKAERPDRGANENTFSKKGESARFGGKIERGSRPASNKKFEDRSESRGSFIPREKEDRADRRPKREFDDEKEDRPRFTSDRSEGGKRPERKNDRTGRPSRFGDRPERKPFGDRSERVERTERGDRKNDKRSYGDRKERFDGKKPSFSGKPSRGDGQKKTNDRFSSPRNDKKRFESKPRFGAQATRFSKDSRKVESKREARPESTREGVRLNKYIANSGVCSRRAADELIAQGLITINGVVVTEMGIRVMSGDVVKYGGEALSFEKFVYLLMNKPKDFITTVDDPDGRKTVMDIIGSNVNERVYPVGRLDRATTGVLLLTNDGDLAKKLTHPSHGVKKIYHVTTTKSISKIDLDRLAAGIELEDGFVKPDHVSYVGENDNRKEIGIEIHSGKNRIIRRLMESLGYSVAKLDRVMFAGLTKKKLARGQWRTLTDKEVGFLKMI
ncbi:MAG: pseudouridine synthase [Flavobacteriales bacterium]|nr:pseudouridine synthase [Flavobacteriales bacterium]